MNLGRNSNGWQAGHLSSPPPSRLRHPAVLAHHPAGPSSSSKWPAEQSSHPSRHHQEHANSLSTQSSWLDSQAKDDGALVDGNQGTTPPHDLKQHRKNNHKEVERRRRETINEGITELQKIVPGSEKNKGEILKQAVKYIQLLKESEMRNIEKWTLERLLTGQTITELRNKVQRLERDCQKLEKANDTLETNNQILSRLLDQLHGKAPGRPPQAAEEDPTGSDPSSSTHYNDREYPSAPSRKWTPATPRHHHSSRSSPITQPSTWKTSSRGISSSGKREPTEGSECKPSKMMKPRNSLALESEDRPKTTEQ